MPWLLLALTLASVSFWAATSHRLRWSRRRLASRLRRLPESVRSAGRRRREGALARRSGLRDADLEQIKERVGSAFHPIQSWWEPGKIEGSSRHVSAALYARHRDEMLQLTSRRQTVRIVAPRLDCLEFVAIQAPDDGACERVVVRVDFSAYATLVDTRNGQLLEGVHAKRRALREHWALVPHPETGAWVVDSIDALPERRSPALARAVPAPRCVHPA